MDILKEIKNPPKKYRPVPFWSWNEKLTPEETQRQIEIMDKAGIGGYFMHARGGLETEYLGEEWFENVDVGVNEGKKRDMGAWAYDENGWPSGFAGGKVNGLGEVYWQKYLRMEKGENNTDRTITNLNGYHFYYDVNRFYVDTLDKKVIKEFIECSYRPYYERYGNDMPGVFTDEPQISRNGIPWSLILPEEYKKAYGENLLEKLDELFLNTGDYKNTRFKFWKLVTKLFSESFAKQIYDYCEECGMQLTGHMVLEETMEIQITSNGAIMPNYEYFHVPGMDWLTRKKMIPLTALQVSSVAHQLGKKRILSETFALCGHNVSFEELRGMYEGQMVRGINLLCPHLQGYSLRGIRKRDYPPAMYYQQPWWEEYSTFIDAMTRIGMLIAEGEIKYDTLLIHPQSTAWTMFNNDKNEGLNEFDKKLADTIDALEKKHILFHLGDETIMEHHARVEGKEIIIGNQRYTRIIKPLGDTMFDSTKALLDEFVKNGGEMVDACDVPCNNVVDSEMITYTYREFEEFKMHYLVNEFGESVSAKININGKKLDIKTGELLPFDGYNDFAPYSSIVIIEDGTENVAMAEKKNLKKLDIGGKWKVESIEDNALVLDYCDYWFDGELVDENAYILDVADKANKLERKTKVDLLFKFDVKSVPEVIYLVCETPEKFDISVNGEKIDKKDFGYFMDVAFRKLDISSFVKVGCNEITMSCDFVQSAEVYQMIKNSMSFEGEKNKLHYDIEIEGLFLVGQFGVETCGSFETLDRDACRYKGGFSITALPEIIELVNIEKQGFPFFSGHMTVSKNFRLEDEGYVLDVEKKGINGIEVKVNGEASDKLIWNPYTADLSDYLKVGDNKVELTIVNNLRNLMGPHHLEEGECLGVGPGHFYKGESPFNYGYNIGWNDNYCFVETSIKTK